MDRVKTYPDPLDPRNYGIYPTGFLRTEYVQGYIKIDENIEEEEVKAEIEALVEQAREIEESNEN